MTEADNGYPQMVKEIAVIAFPNLMTLSLSNDCLTQFTTASSLSNP